MTSINLNQIKILLVDDDPVSNFIASRKLSKFGIENIDSVENGAEALEYLKNQSPDLIFLDINMPIMDGHEFMIEYKMRELSEDIHIYILSSSDRACDRGRFSGFNNIFGYIEKPLEEANIIKAIDKLQVLL